MGPLAVLEKIIGLTRILDFFDRGAINQLACSATGSGVVMLCHLAVTCVSIGIFCWLAQKLYDAITKPLYKLIDRRSRTNTIISAK